MRKFIFLLISALFLFANITYTIPLKETKQIQINKAVLLAQYIYDLKKLNKILKMLYNNKGFKESTQMAEMNFKNDKSVYSIEYIKMILSILNGKCKNGGYIQDIKDKFSNYEIYIIDYPYKKLLTYDFDIIEKRIKKNLIELNKNLKEEKNIKPILKHIFLNLIFALEEIKNETLKLKNLKIIYPFSKYEDEKYCLPKNLAQLDGNTNFADIINFILNGDKKLKIYGIKKYYEIFYKNDLKSFVIFH